MERHQTIRIYNAKSGMPSVENARRNLITTIREARLAGVRILKIIHGYGSTGVGGALRNALRTSLVRRRKEGLVATIVYGEEWTMFNEHARALCDRCPELRNDPDYNQENPGITIIEL